MGRGVKCPGGTLLYNMLYTIIQLLHNKFTWCFHKAKQVYLYSPCKRTRNLIIQLLQNLSKFNNSVWTQTVDSECSRHSIGNKQ